MTEEEKKAGKTLDPDNLSDEQLEEIYGGFKTTPYRPSIRRPGEGVGPPQGNMQSLQQEYQAHMADGGTRESWHAILHDKFGLNFRKRGE